MTEQTFAAQIKRQEQEEFDQAYANEVAAEMQLRARLRPAPQTPGVLSIGSAIVILDY